MISATQAGGGEEEKLICCCVFFPEGGFRLESESNASDFKLLSYLIVVKNK